MKKLNFVYLFICALLFSACNDDTFDSMGSYSEGQPAKLSVRVKVPEPTDIKSRAMGQERETAIEQLALVAFEVNSGRKMAVDFTGKLQNTSWNTSGASVYTLTEDIDVLTGRYRAYFVANWNSVYGAKNSTGTAYTFAEIAAMSESEIQQLMFHNYALHVDLYGNDGMPMTCEIKPGDTNFPNGLEIVDGTNKLDNVVLRRATAHIHFVIANETDASKYADANNMPNFIPTRYTVYRVPTYTNGFSQANFEVIQSGTFDMSVPNPVVQQPDQSDNGYEFDFHMLENRQPLATNTIATQGDRERWDYSSETTQGSAVNSYADRKFINAPAGSTFVVIDGQYSGPATQDATGKYTNEQYYGNLSYVIHLGNFNTASNVPSHPGSLQDFSVYRNELQTYNVTVQGAHAIVVNVDVTNPGEQGNAAVEGQLTLQPVAALDAHYCKVMLRIPKTKIETNLADNKVILATVANNFLQQEFTVDQLTANDADYKWIQFQRPTSEDVFPRYAGENRHGATGYAYITDLLADLAACKAGTKTNPTYALDDGDNYIVAAFVDENVYKDQTYPMNTWAGDVISNRLMTVNPERKVSPDGVSIISGTTAFTISQLPISTVYSLDPSLTGTDKDTYNPFGLEQDMEKSKGYTLTLSNSTSNTYKTNQFFASTLEWDAPTSADASNWNRFNTQANNLHWFSNIQDGETGLADDYDSFYKFDSSTNNYTFVPGDNFTTVSRSIAVHNRDLNGNGYINPDELRWYVPSYIQYLVYNFGYSIIEESLRLNSDAEDQAYLDYYGAGTNWDLAVPKYYTTGPSKQRLYWATQRGAGTENTITSWQPELNRVRFARNLGQFDGASTQPYTPMMQKGTINNPDAPRILRTLNPTISRSFNVTVPYPLVFAGEVYNDLPKAFEYMSAALTMYQKTDTDDYHNFANGSTPQEEYNRMLSCTLTKYKAKYTNYTGDVLPNGWRIPNQRELAAMWIYDIPSTLISSTVKYAIWSCTFVDSKLWTERANYPMAIQDGSLALPPGMYSVSDGYIILVRDVDPTTGEPLAEQTFDETNNTPITSYTKRTKRTR
ncbi:MAG: hypothetical protein NC111_02740 [Bacteroides sp.]|nr:hypothetical protein [Bacteroides sp.]MCM1413255.1 hypothetical protein [Bacteroides sp.]MCM1471435.1 hypothetical protein [Bacteroides sp.]